MAITQGQTHVLDESINGVSSLEGILGRLFAEQRRLREQLEQIREQLDQVNREVLRVQKDYCVDDQHELHYRKCVQHLLGIDPYLDPSEIEEALRTHQTFEEFLAEVEAEGNEQPEVANG